jgi:high-affinity iron transporter
MRPTLLPYAFVAALLLAPAGMASQAVQFLHAADVLVALDRTIWDTSWLLSEGSIFGRMLHALIGYTERPSEMQLIVYVTTLFAMFLLMRIARPAPVKEKPVAA